MGNFLLALQFLTIIPVRIKDAIEQERLCCSVIYFPLVGLFLGMTLAGLNLIFSYLDFSILLVNVILVITLAVLTGGLHLDGLADTFDAFCSRKDKEGLFNIMRDPHIGTMGVLSLIFVILLKIVLFSSFTAATKNIALILMCVLSRWSLVLPLYSFSYAHKEGKAKGFFGSLSFSCFLFTTLVTLLFATLIWNWKGLFAFIAAFLFSYFFNRYINKRLDGITGDTLGAAVELNEIAVLVACLMAARI